jgi:hypothetical protein
VNRSSPRLEIAAEAAILLALAALLGIGIAVHEPWSDEAQSWLLARDPSLAALLGTFLRYEGHPPLWYLLLKGLIAAHLPYKSQNVLSAAAALAASVMIVRTRPIPLLVRALLPFTYFLAWQYAVVARSYALVAPIVVGIALIYERRTERLALFTALLVAVMNVSVHGASMAAALAALYAVDVYRGKQPRPALRGAIIAVIVLAISSALLICS